MNIGILIDFDSRPTEGGGHSYISLFLHKLLSSKIYQDFVIVSHFPAEQLKKQYHFPDHIPVYDLTKKERVKLLFLKALSASCRKLKIFSALNSFLEEQQKKLYYSSFVRMKIQALLYLPYNRIYTLELPFFYMLWDIGHRTISLFPEVSYYGKFKYREDVYRDVLPRAYRIVAETEAGKSDIEFYYGIKRDRITVVPIFAGDVINSSYTSQEASAFFSSKGIKQQKYLFYPAQFWPHKNHVNLLHAFRALLTKQHDLQLVLCGDDKNNLEHVVSVIKELSLEKHVIILGFVGELKYVRALYENAFALIMPTFLGPSNMPLLEAMALGCPAICSDLEGHRELGADCMLYIQPEEPDSMVEKVEFLIFNPQEKQKLSENARRRYLQSSNHVENGISILGEEFKRLKNIRRCWE